MKGYILDTNVLNALIDFRSPHRAEARSRLEKIGSDLIFVSAITLGEIEFGIAVAPSFRGEELEEFRRRVKTEFPQTLSVTPTTAEDYGSLRRGLFERFSPTEARSNSRRVEQLIDPATGDSLGIDENDLWIASQASEMNLTLVSHDRMRRIGAVSAPNVVIETWF
ncbi:MAG: type II toxin-antitoxin system VapC family toxin [Archangium sp.]|nr:type II toxin-antitoxin system VapC family toxin [Archangium sp.]